jgi:hypothetical protein
MRNRPIAADLSISLIFGYRLANCHALQLASNDVLNPLTRIKVNIMGNRAVITFSENPNSTGIYLQWNGGPESILAFCHAARDMGARSPGSDSQYAMAGLMRAITLFLHNEPGELLSVGIGPLSTLDCDNYDNGLYIVGPDWEIQTRKYNRDSAMTVSDLPETDYGKNKYLTIRAAILEKHVKLCELKKAA